MVNVCRVQGGNDQEQKLATHLHLSCPLYILFRLCHTHHPFTVAHSKIVPQTVGIVGRFCLFDRLGAIFLVVTGWCSVSAARGGLCWEGERVGG